MKAVILAAGLSSRIRSLTNGAPKCLLAFGDRTLLDCQIRSLFDAGIQSLAIVVGHGKHYIVDHVAQHHPERCSQITFIVNPHFAQTNNMYSLWLAKGWIGKSSFLCLNADVLYHPDILLPLMAGGEDFCVVVDRDFREETTKVIIRDGRVVTMKKSLSREEASGTFVNLAAFSAKGTGLLFARAEAMFREGQRNQFYNDVISTLAGEGVRVGFAETGGLPWAEVDDPHDFFHARTEVYPRIESALPVAFPVLDFTPVAVPANGRSS